MANLLFLIELLLAILAIIYWCKIAFSGIRIDLNNKLYEENGDEE